MSSGFSAQRKTHSPIIARTPTANPDKNPIRRFISNTPLHFFERRLMRRHGRISRECKSFIAVLD
jgi:hypothetical protein